eukprot:2996319-Pyramimonas_sp.AAC.2
MSARSLKHAAGAAAYRAVLASSVFFACIEKLQDAFDDDEAHIDAVVHPVHCKSSVIMLHQNYLELSKTSQAPSLFGPKLQKTMTNIVQGHVPFRSFQDLLYDRMRYWHKRFLDELGDILPS